jgi:3',5'-cyclic AMP phosphodiesterase CpdA
MIRLAHLSDLHFGATDPEAVSALADAIGAAAPDLVIFTGDLTQAGRRREFAEAAAFVDRLDRQALVVPGNHDAPVYSIGLRFIDPWGRFRSAFGSQTDSVVTLPGAVIVGLNSARRMSLSLDWSLGSLSRRQIDYAARALSTAPDDALRIVAMHHPVLAGPGRAGAAVVGRAETALETFAGVAADLVLTGHVHVAQAGIHDRGDHSIIVARAGTASSTRQRGETPSYNLIDMENERVAVSIFRFSDGGYQCAAEHAFVRPKGGSWREKLAPADPPAGNHHPAAAVYASRRHDA